MSLFYISDYKRGVGLGIFSNGIEGSDSYGTVANHNISKRKTKTKFKSLIRHS